MNIEVLGSGGEVVQSDEMQGKYLTFWTDEQLFGVPIVHVVQIVGIQEITQIPGFPHYMKGIINMRGSVIPLMDMRLRLSRAEIGYNERTSIIVISIKDRLTGIIVDNVDEVTSISDDIIAETPNKDGDAGFVTGIGKLEKKLVLLLNLEAVLGGENLEYL